MPRKKKKKPFWKSHLLKDIIAIFLSLGAVIIFLSFSHKSGYIGEILNQKVFNIAFGLGRYFLPFLLLVLAWFLSKTEGNKYKHTHLIGAILAIISICGLIHTNIDLNQMVNYAQQGLGGGYLGLIAYPIKIYIGKIATYVFFIGLLLISTFLLFNTTLAHFILIHKKLLLGLGWIGKIIWKSALIVFIKPLKKYTYDKLDIKNDYENEEEEDGDEEDEDYEDEEETDEDEDYEDEDEEYEEEDDGDEDEEDDINNDNKNSEEKNEIQNNNFKNNTNEQLDETTNSVWEKKIIIRKIPSLKLLTSKKSKPTSGDIKANAKTIKDTLAEFHIDVTMGEIKIGPTVTQYSFKPAKGIKLSRITSLTNDLALALAAHPIRIEAPIPGKSLVGIEVPNQKTAMVTFKELLTNKEFKNRKHNLMIALGKDVGGKVWFADLPKMPHMLIAGATGSGKTVCINTIIMSLLYQNTAETLRLIMVDPKRVELTLYNGIPHLLTPVITNVQQTVNALKWTISEMERRFELFSKDQSRDIQSYNRKHPDKKVPYIVFIIDELADLMSMAANEVEASIIRLAQMARAVGIHLILATQRPSVDIITGLMKANIPGRVAFSVASSVDSRTILDTPGAEKLLGRGDMLLLTAELSKPIRIQGAYISEEEVKNVVNYLKGGGIPEYDETIISRTNNSNNSNNYNQQNTDYDPLFNDAKQVIIQAGKASASLLQRKLKVGYARAARILDELEEAGIVGPANGAKPREILLKNTTNGKHEAGGELNVYNQNNNQINSDEKTE